MESSPQGSVGPNSDISTVVMVRGSCHQQWHQHAVHILPHHATHRHAEQDSANGSSLVNLPGHAISHLTFLCHLQGFMGRKEPFIAGTHNFCSNTCLFSTLFEVHLWSPGHPFPKHQVSSGGLSHISQGSCHLHITI